MEINGHSHTNPSIKVEWNPETQQTTIAFDSTQFKTWDFVIAVLHMAMQSAEASKKLAQMQNMQQQMAEAAQAQKIAGLLRR